VPGWLQRYFSKNEDVCSCSTDTREVPQWPENREDDHIYSDESANIHSLQNHLWAYRGQQIILTKITRLTIGGVKIQTQCLTAELALNWYSISTSLNKQKAAKLKRYQFEGDHHPSPTWFLYYTIRFTTARQYKNILD